jgi:heat shock protein HslJ
MNEHAKIQLTGSAWTLVSFETDTGVIPSLTEAPATLTFSPDVEQTNRLSGSSGCNRYFGTYTLTSDRLQISQLGSTRMMCSPDRMDQETRLFQALSTAERCELSKGQLLIIYTGGTLRSAPIANVTVNSAQP